jgi:hypothetical protein
VRNIHGAGNEQMRPLYTCFYTIGSFYEREAARLRESLDALGLPHDLRGVTSQGDWFANTQQTVQHILTMMNDYPDRPIVQLDADAIVKRRPDLFEDGLDCDVAAHFRKGTELLNGTLYLAPTDGARLVMERYRDGVESHPNHANEQWWLEVAVRETADLFRFKNLPPSYAWIPDIMRDDLAPGEKVVIAHMQASRERTMTDATRRRRSWIAEWESRASA